MKHRIKHFANKHKEFFDYLLEDTYLTEEPITVNEFRDYWDFAFNNHVVSFSYEDIEPNTGLEPQQITEWFNKYTLNL